MNMEHLPQMQNDVNKRESVNLPEWIGKYEIIGQNAYDNVRKLSFALPIVAATLGSISPERAQAVEIPSDATYEQGVKLLAEATRTEAFETGAVFIQLPDGETRWYSFEGKETSIDPRNSLTGLDEVVDSKASNNNLNRGDRLNIIFLHNHPQHSAVVEGLVNEDGQLSSYPPSGAGLADGFADTGYHGHQKIAEHIAQVELEHGIDISSVHQLVDPLGVWTYQLDLDEAEKAGNEFLTHTIKTEMREATYETERTLLQAELDEVREQIANFEYPPEWHDLNEQRRKLLFEKRISEMTGEESEVDFASRLPEVRAELRRIESEVGLDELEKRRDAISTELAELRSNYSELNASARESIRNKISDKVDSLETLRGAWIMSVVENGIEKTLQGGLYDSLRQAYQDVGVSVSYKTFSE